MDDELIVKELKGSPWRDYVWTSEHAGVVRVHIEKPLKLIYRPGGTTHRVQTKDRVFIVPAVGFFGCRVEYAPANPKNPARF